MLCFKSILQNVFVVVTIASFSDHNKMSNTNVYTMSYMMFKKCYDFTLRGTFLIVLCMFFFS